MNYTRPFLVYFILSLSLVSQCANSNRRFDENSIVIGTTTEPENLNPLYPLSSISSDVNTLIFNNLLRLNEDLISFSPELATSYRFSDDSLAVTFFLNTNIFWHDGEKMTAEDVVFTYEMQTNKSVAWDGLSYKKNISRVLAVNDSTVVFRFKKRTPFMLMDANEGKILPKHILSQYSPEDLFTTEFSHHPIGTGPYKLTEWKNQQYLLLTKNESYFKPTKPHISSVIFKIVTDKSILFQQILTNEVDLVHDVSPQNINRIEKNYSQLKVLQYAGKNYDFIGWNLVNKDSFDTLKKKISANPSKTIPKIKPHRLFGDVKIRQALSMVIDREKICQNLMKGNAEPISQPYLIFPDFNKNMPPAPYNPKTAKKILEECGWKDSDGDGILDKEGIPFRFTLYTNAGNPWREQLMMVLQQEFKTLAIEMIPRKVEANYLVSKIIPEKKFDALLLGWNTSIKPDFTALFHSSQYLHPFHLTGYYSADLDSLLTKNISAENLHCYTKTLKKINTILSEDAPYTWLYFKNNNVVYNKKIKNFKPSIINKYQYLEDFKIK